MDSVCILFAMILTSGILMVHSSPLPVTTTTEPHYSTTAENVEKANQDALENPISNVTLPEYVIVPLEDVIFGLDTNTIVQFTNLQLYIPSDLHLGENDPDFSKMILSINTVIGTLEVKGDYSIYVYGYYVTNKGYVNMKLQNVTVIGETGLALTPVALLALSYNFVYNPQAIHVEISPLFKDTVTQEERLSNEILSEPIVTLIKNQVDYHLNFYTESYINMILGKISVFTVGHKKEQSFIEEPFNQVVQIGDLFDELLVDVRRVIVEKGHNEINISSFYRNFSEKVDSTYVTGDFSAENGWVSGISSIRRFSNVSLSKTEDVFILSAGVDFNQLEMGYDKYKAVFNEKEIIGELDGTFLQTNMIMKVSMNPKQDGTCESVLNELRALKMNGYRIQNISNIGSFDWLRRRINNWLIGYVQIKIFKQIEKELADAVHSSLNRFDCGDYLPHLKVLI